MLSFQKINDLKNSSLKTRYDRKKFIPETNYAVAMGRVSLKANKDKGNSDLDQLEHLNNYAKRKKLKIEKTWDVAETATKHEKRKNFHSLIDFVEDSQNTSKPIKHVLFAYTSRGSRNPASKRILEQLMDLGVSIHFTEDNLILNSHSDISAKIVWEIKAIQDEEEARKLKNITWNGTIKRLEEGLLPGKAPFGYRNKRLKELKGKSVFVFHKREAEFIKEYYELFSTELYSQLELLRMLKEKYSDIKYPNETKINKIITNPFYYGYFIWADQLWQGHPEYHPPLMSYALWKRVQDILKKRKRTSREGLNHPFIQLMKCGGKILDEHGNETDEDCGCSITAEDKKKPLKEGGFNIHRYYRCGSRSTKNCSQRSRPFLKQHGKKFVSYTEENLEELFLQIVRPISFTKEQVEWMRQMLQKHHNEVSGTENQRLVKAQGRYQQVFQHRKIAYSDRLNGSITSEMWKEKDEELLEEQQELKAEMDAIEEGCDERVQQGIALIELLEGTEITWKNASKESKARIIKLLVSNLVLRNGSIEYHYKKPFDMLANSTGKEKWSERLDSNQRPLAPKASALPSCATLRLHNGSVHL